MKSKTIKKVITKKMEDWIESIEDETLKKTLKGTVIVTGGCIASMLLKEKVNDYDIYFNSKEVVVDVVKYYLKKFIGDDPIELKRIIVEGSEKIDWKEKDVGYEICEDRVKILIKSQGILREKVKEILNEEGSIETESENKDKFRPICITSNAVTLSDKVQLITRFYGEPEEIHSNYDYIHATNYWYKRKLVLNEKALESLLTRELKYSGSKYPLCSIMRSKKFIQRGWTINAGQYLKMAMQLNALDLNDVETLEEQLIGVDSAYFNAVISCLKEKDKTIVDTAYLMEVIDRIF